MIHKFEQTIDHKRPSSSHQKTSAILPSLSLCMEGYPRLSFVRWLTALFVSARIDGKLAGQSLVCSGIKDPRNRQHPAVSECDDRLFPVNEAGSPSVGDAGYLDRVGAVRKFFQVQQRAKVTPYFARIVGDPSDRVIIQRVHSGSQIMGDDPVFLIKTNQRWMIRIPLVVAMKKGVFDAYGGSF